MNRTRSEIERLLAQRLEFLIGIGHGMRAPLTGIAGFGAILAEQAAVASDPTAREASAYIRSEADKLVELLNQLLDCGQVEQGPAAARERADRPCQNGPAGDRALRRPPPRRQIRNLRRSAGGHRRRLLSQAHAGGDQPT
ncbi:MAG: histidine kinase dimerization/phospho-acceptor domain-containing protein [Acidimicrobiia bacterium]